MYPSLYLSIYISTYLSISEYLCGRGINQIFEYSLNNVFKILTKNNKKNNSQRAIQISWILAAKQMYLQNFSMPVRPSVHFK